MLTDNEIRRKLVETLEKKNKNKHYRIIEELSICDGLARADVVIANGLLHGYEIKSDFDTLERLENQIKHYEKTFDKCTIVIGEKFIDVIEEKVPEYWGIIMAYMNRYGNVSIKRIRASKFNKQIEATNLLDLLWRNEIIKYLKENKIRGYSNKDKFGLKELVISNIPLNKIKEFTRETLKTRTGWRGDLP
ncbi:sce7726 family protein [Ureibacillus thermophilus]|uniref:Sce7726 family protein n=1 Tax=Ureibacillus thermophilus TaxID=367743 RepID=A0A4P6UXI9_9BACL|nr:sce7726 family protein [Ureibacillus thermophilus]QBK26898.1 hypothetical protein DKZ56_14235 [Ureibacillus thermophilus]